MRIVFRSFTLIVNEATHGEVSRSVVVIARSQKVDLRATASRGQPPVSHKKFGEFLFGLGVHVWRPVV